MLLCGAVVGGRGPPRLGHGEPASPVHLQRRPRRSHGGWDLILVFLALLCCTVLEFSLDNLFSYTRSSASFGKCIAVYYG